MCSISPPDVFNLASGCDVSPKGGVCETVSPKYFLLAKVVVDAVDELPGGDPLRWVVLRVGIQTVQAFSACDKETHFLGIVWDAIASKRHIRSGSLLHLQFVATAETAACEPWPVVLASLVTVSELDALVYV